MGFLQHPPPAASPSTLTLMPPTAPPADYHETEYGRAGEKLETQLKNEKSFDLLTISTCFLSSSIKVVVSSALILATGALELWCEHNAWI